MEEFEPSSDAGNRKRMSSSQISTLGIGYCGVRNKFRRLDLEMEEFELPRFGIGNGGVRVKFRCLEL